MTDPGNKSAQTAPSILFVARDVDIGGAQRQMIDLASGLHECGWSVIVATFYPGGALEQELRATGVRTICLDKKGRWDISGFMLRLLRLIRREQPQFAHGLLNMPNLLLALLKPFAGSTRIVWGIAASDMDLTHYDWLMRMEFRFAVLLSRHADLMISNSRSGAEHHVSSGYAAERLVVIPNGVDMKRFRPDRAAGQRLRAGWGVAPHEILIGLVGRLDPMKDHENFLRASAEVAAARPAARFICVGDGPAEYRARLRDFAAALSLDDRLIWAGARDDIGDVYNAFDLNVCSSLSEGLPNTVTEAMASGIGCVVTDVGDCAEVVEGLGWVCPPGDSSALAAAMIAALDALPHDAAALRARIATRYSASARLGRTTRELLQVLESSNTCLERKQLSRKW